MFRRKKSTTDVEQRPTPAISISGPMHISAQAPHAQSSHAAPTTPLYERFAKTTNPNGNGALPGQARKSMTSVRPRVVSESEEGGMRKSELRHERDGRSGGVAVRAGGRVGLGISAPSREDVARVSGQGRHQHQQMSPPTSPTFPRANGTSAAIPRQMPNVSADALDDPTPPTSLLVKKARPLPEPKTAATAKRAEKNGAHLTRMMTPPSPPTTTQHLPPVTPAQPAALQISSHVPTRPPDSSLSPPLPDETGALPSLGNLKVSPSLGNSLEAPRGPRRTRYSPLAAFGPPVSTSTSAGSSSSVPSAQETPPPPPPPKPLSSIGSIPNITTSHLSDTTQNLGIGTSRPSTDSFNYSDRHASVQPLKTASVELRVGLGADELETFHSPLFGTGFNTRTNEKYERDDDTDIDPRVKQASRHRGEPSNTTSQDSLPVLSSNVRAASNIGNGDVDMEDEDENDHIVSWSRGRSGRMVPRTIQDVPTNTAAPPTPPSPPAPTLSMILDARPGQVESGLAVQRTESVSSTGSMRRKVTMYTTYTDEDVPELPGIQQTHQQTPRTLIRGQIPTPPTSVDGHGNDQNQRLTITGILEEEQSPDVPSPSSLINRSIRGMNLHHAIPESSSSSPSSPVPSTGNLVDSRPKPAESHGNNAISNMTAIKVVAPSLVASSSSSSANLSSQDELQGRPTPKLRTQNLPLQTYSPQPDYRQSQQHEAPPSPPQSPPQPVTPVVLASQPGPRTRSKSRTRSTRPGTGSSSHSQHYVPPSSASSSDGPARSPSALSALNPFSSGSTGGIGHTHRKLTKTPPHSVRPRADSTNTVEQHQIQHQRTITESPEQMDLLVDADPFAKGEVVRAPALGDPASISGASMPPPVPPFARSQCSGASSGPASPASPGDYVSSRAHRRGQGLDARSREDARAFASRWDATDRKECLKPSAPESGTNGVGQMEAEPESEPEPEPAEPTFYPLEKHLMHAELLGALLPYLTFRDWCMVAAVNDALRRQIEHKRELRELVLEHYLHTVGYGRWRWSTKEHIMLTFRDLNSYMRGVSIPSHQYSVYAKAWLDAKQQVQERPDDEYLKFNLKTASAQKSLLASSCRAFTRVVLRLRAQAEAMEKDAEGDAVVYQFTPPQSSASVNAKAHAPAQIQNHARRSMSRARAGSPSRPGSPGASSLSHSQHGHVLNGSSNGHGSAKINRYERAALAGLGPHFRSPLFRLGHSPCLRVCIPNPEGVWLSDSSVLECEKELKRAGVIPLLRAGDVVWDIAVGDEGNDGRMVWDGNYLIDLDYTYSRSGEVPQYLHTLAFPPSYFHRVIRAPGNPICHIDISPWGEEIAANLQLLQDRIKTETPQGGHHTVVRWIHRSRFRIRPNPYTNAPTPISGTSLSVDPGWYGTVIIEFEGTNEGLADLQQRCKSGFPPRAVGRENDAAANVKAASKVFRLLRERSRPGEIWLRAVREKERLL
ncbi:hypothetical protein ACEPAF_124 [Sanghuangporus sanghuang]